jgi:UDP-N-acetyl-D-galactosamine dehydrogenase
MTLARKIAIIGLGYVGLPIVIAFARKGAEIIGFDISSRRVAELKARRDRTREVEEADLALPGLCFTDDPADLTAADFFIVTVPTPIDDAHQPDMSMVLSACETIGKALTPGSIVVFESTVYPGATEDDCVPVLARASGLVPGRDFTVGYSPERINPGDKEHRFETIKRVVAGQDEATTKIVADVYGSVVTAGIHVAPSIRTAEAAKVIENTQRDLNIALMNELSAIFEKLGLDTHDVLAAAGTKWNFLPFTPGLVGGHCIGVDPYYLTHRAERAGYHCEVILSGRRINDVAGKRIARICVQMLLRRGGGKRVAVLGLTFKEDVPDIRNTRVIDIVSELQSFGLEPLVSDPLADAAEVRDEYGITLVELDTLVDIDAVILAVPHAGYVKAGWRLPLELLGNGGGPVLDVKAKLDRATLPTCIELWRP